MSSRRPTRFRRPTRAGCSAAGALLAALAVIALCDRGAIARAQEPHTHANGSHPHAADAHDHTHSAGARHGEDAEHGQADAHGDEHGAGGLWSDLPFWGLVAFLGFLWVVKTLGGKALTSSMASREAEENQLISAAEKLRAQAAEQLRAQRGQIEALDEEIREVLDEAGRDAEHTRREIRAVAEREAQIARARAELEISRVKDQTLKDLFDNFTQRVIEATEERLRGQIGPAEQERLIDAALEEFTSGQRQTV